MDVRYLGFAKSNSPFYSKQAMDLARSILRPMPLPSSWIQGLSGPWETWAPADLELRQQGWKIHVSATPDNAETILERVGRICVDERVPFKFICTKEQLITRNSKSADRSASGKFITIYPHNDEHLAVLVEKLEASVGGLPGPFILSDVRYQQGPIYFRFGGFRPLHKVDQRQSSISCLVTPEGELVEDERVPIFRCPTWVKIPDIVQASIYIQRAPGARSALDDYSDLKAMHFSNSGGVYRATSSTGKISVLKEARPHAGLDRTGRDSTARLAQEAANLRALEATGIAPRLIRNFHAWEHQYLEIEYIEGVTLKKWNVQNHPFAAGADEATIQIYTERLLAILHRIASAIDEAHSEGVVIGDLHPSNILLQPDDSVKLIDLEDSRSLDEISSAPFNAFGYEAPVGLAASKSDWYGFSRLIAAAFYIATPIEVLAPEYWDTVRRWIGDRFGASPITLLDLAEERAGMRAGPTTFTPTVRVAPWSMCLAAIGLRQARDMVAEGIVMSDNKKSLDQPFYPADIRYWEGSGHLNAATGTAGILLTLGRSGVAFPQDVFDRFALTVGGEYKRMPLGLFSGVAGIATTLQERGSEALAETLFSHLEANVASIRGVDLAEGLSGIGLSLLRSALHAGDEDRIQYAVTVADVIVDRLFTAPVAQLTESLNTAGGLFHGWSGIALFLAEVALHTGKERYLAFAKEAINADLTNSVWTEAGALHTLDRTRSRSLPYLANGTSGMLIPLNAIRQLDPTLSCNEDKIDGILKACDSREYAFAGLFNGRAGIISSLSYAQKLPGAPDILERQIEYLFDYALELEGRLVFPGDNYLRLSMDLSTGSAGILSALVASEQGGTTPWLPVMSPQKIRQPENRFTAAESTAVAFNFAK